MHGGLDELDRQFFNELADELPWELLHCLDHCKHFTHSISWDSRVAWVTRDTWVTSGGVKTLPGPKDHHFVRPNAGMASAVLGGVRLGGDSRQQNVQKPTHRGSRPYTLDAGNAPNLDCNASHKL